MQICKGILDRIRYEIITHSPQISAATHINLSFALAKSAMCQVTLPGGSPPCDDSAIQAAVVLSSQQTAAMFSTQAEMRKTGQLWEEQVSST